MMSQINVNINKIYVKKTVQFIYSACKGDIMVVDIKQHKSQFKNSNFTITQSAKFLVQKFTPFGRPSSEIPRRRNK